MRSDRYRVADQGLHVGCSVMAARIAAVGNAGVFEWDTGLAKGVTQLLSSLTEVRYSPFYTYDLAFEALVDTLQRHQATRPWGGSLKSIFWLLLELVSRNRNEGPWVWLDYRQDRCLFSTHIVAPCFLTILHQVRSKTFNLKEVSTPCASYWVGGLQVFESIA